MGKILTTILAGAMAFGLNGCTWETGGSEIKSETNISEIKSVPETKIERLSEPIYVVTPVQDRLIVKREEWNLNNTWMDNKINWSRYSTCCLKLKEPIEGDYSPQCLTDTGWEKVHIEVGEELWIFNYNSKDDVAFTDFDCDRKVDKMYNNRLGQHKSRFEPGTEELFKKADQYFFGYKNKLREGVDLELETKKWLAGRKRKNSGFLDNL
jgi:hypothetical protein